ncbi:hypothetical protein [Fodinibius sp.]|uniref:hypothetical protein n=1 Tax=Fodinibius sp. TaxID=1872440 RepID=UPI002ACEA3A6|nr:hypothetical protein [Fodinibius sp.]MDZ7660746.1 hypothetical protein [Fodinibius sp.]
MYTNRLRDAVDRNDIGGIKRIVKRLAKREKEKGISKEDNPTGLQYVCDNFIETEKQIKDMIWTSKHAFIWALITSLYSVLAISLIDLIETNLCKVK